jgi:hypothetical protein
LVSIKNYEISLIKSEWFWSLNKCKNLLTKIIFFLSKVPVFTNSKISFYLKLILVLRIVKWMKNYENVKK